MDDRRSNADDERPASNTTSDDWPAPDRPSGDQVAFGVASPSEHRWHASAAVVVAIVLQLVLPDRVVRGLGPRWLIPALEGALLVALTIANPAGRITKESVRLRSMSMTLIALISLANVIALGELINALLNHTKAGGQTLVYASI